MPENSSKEKGAILRKDYFNWISDHVHKLKHRLITISHAGQTGHRGSNSSINEL